MLINLWFTPVNLMCVIRCAEVWRYMHDECFFGWTITYRYKILWEQRRWHGTLWRHTVKSKKNSRNEAPKLNNKESEPYNSRHEAPKLTTKKRKSTL